MSMPDMPMPTPQNSVSMHMAFFSGKNVVILFDGWPGADHLGMYILALAVVFLLAAAVELLTLKPRELSPAFGALVLASVNALRMGLAYLIMLSVMSYNAGVFVAAVSGHAVGRFAVKYGELTAVAKPADFDP